MVLATDQMGGYDFLGNRNLRRIKSNRALICYEKFIDPDTGFRRAWRLARIFWRQQLKITGGSKKVRSRVARCDLALSRLNKNDQAK